MTAQYMQELNRQQPNNGSNKGARILYVEDSNIIQDAISTLLELNGYQVASASNGQEGVEMTLTWKPDLVLMDLRMPVMDGFTAISKIKLNPSTSQIPIIVVSAWNGRKERTEAELAGAADFFVKPPDLNRLIQAIEQAVTTPYQPVH